MRKTDKYIGYTNARNDKLFHSWSFGSVNIRSGKERDEGGKLYTIAKEVSRADLTFCCLQEVKYLNSGKKLIELDNGEKFEFHWCGKKKRREAGVGFLIKVDSNIVIKDPDIQDPRIMTIDLIVYGFNIRVINAYAPTNSDGNQIKKDIFYRQLRKACEKREKHQKIIVAGDFNASTSLAFQKCNFNGLNILLDDE